MYENDGVPLLAVILAFKKQKYSVLNERGREAELVPMRLHPIPGMIDPGLTTIEAKTRALAKLRETSQKQADSLKLEEIWSFVCHEPREYSSEELCRLYFGKMERNDYLALRLALLSDRIFFKRNKETFHPRPSDTIEELRKAEKVRREREELERLTLEVLRGRLSNPKLPLPAEIMPLVHNLEDLAAGTHGMDQARQKEAKDLIAVFSERNQLDLQGSFEQRAFALLETIGHFHQDTSLALIRHKPPREFSAAAFKEAQQLQPPRTLSECTDKAQRRDCTQLAAMTIDDASTKDMDDALSIEPTPGGFRLGIHISDVASLIQTSSALDSEAMRRATSIYCPDIILNMFPEVVSEEKASLLRETARPCMSCFFEVDHHFALTFTEIVPSLIRVSKRLSYEEVDVLLEKDDHDLSLLYNIACYHEEQRLEDGALKVNKSDAIVVLENGKMKLVEVDEHSPSRGLIGEMMVIANRAFASLAKKHGFPLVFRGQEHPDPSDAPRNDAIPAGPALDYSIRAQLKKSTVSLKPMPHASLGLDAYAQVTSPIRRYLDLCNQRQILAFLRTGKPLYSPEDLGAMIDATEGPLGAAMQVSKESKRYWLMRYMQDHMRNEPIKGTVIRTDLKNPIVEIDKVFLNLPVKINGHVKRGEVLSLRIAAIDPRYDYIKLERI